MKIRYFFLILLVSIAVFVALNLRTLYENTTLVLGNLTHNSAWMRADESIVRYNEAVWLARDGKYLEAKERLTRLLADTGFSHRAETLELYGDILYSTSCALDEVKKLYHLSLDSKREPRVVDKLAFLESDAKKPDTHTGSLNTHTGSESVDAKKKELNDIAKMRGQFLQNDTNPRATATSRLEQLIESERTGEPIIVQDW